MLTGPHTSDKLQMSSRLKTVILRSFRSGFFTKDILTSHSRKSTGIIIIVSDGSIPFKGPCKPSVTVQ